MNYEEVINYYKTVGQAATALRLTDQAVYKWKEAGIDDLRQCMIEVATGGALLAEPSFRVVARS